MNKLLLSILVLASSSISLVLAVDGPLDGAYLHRRKTLAASLSEQAFDKATTFDRRAEQGEAVEQALASTGSAIANVAGESYQTDAEVFSILLKVNTALKEVNTRLDRLERGGSPRQVAQRKRRSRRRRA